MDDSRLQDLPKLKKIMQEVEKLRAMKAFLPVMKALGQDTTEIEQALEQIEIQVRTVTENAEIMD